MADRFRRSATQYLGTLYTEDQRGRTPYKRIVQEGGHTRWFTILMYRNSEPSITPFRCLDRRSATLISSFPSRPTIMSEVAA